MPVSFELITRCRLFNVLIIEHNKYNMDFSWQDLKDEIRAQTKIECSFCEIHTPRDREGIGEISQEACADSHLFFSLLQQKR